MLRQFLNNAEQIAGKYRHRDTGRMRVRLVRTPSLYWANLLNDLLSLSL